MKNKMKSQEFLKNLEIFYNELNYSEDYRIMDIVGRKEKLGIIDAGYENFFTQKLAFFSGKQNTSSNQTPLCILDFGSGTGEFTVMMNLLGHKTIGIELHQTHLKLAKILAKENGLSEDLFVFNDKKELPFPDNHFDLVTSFSVFEHLDQETISWVLPEMHRVCKGHVYTLVPNPIKPIDDHSGLAFLSYMPRWFALLYLKFVKEKYEYSKVTLSGDWDVYYRFLPKLKQLFEDANFIFEFLPDSLHYPPLDKVPPVHKIGKSIKIFGFDLFFGIPLMANFLIKMGRPKQYYYPYLNLVCTPKKENFRQKAHH